MSFSLLRKVFTWQIIATNIELGQGEVCGRVWQSQQHLFDLLPEKGKSEKWY